MCIHSSGVASNALACVQYVLSGGRSLSWRWVNCKERAPKNSVWKMFLQAGRGSGIGLSWSLFQGHRKWGWIVYWVELGLYCTAFIYVISFNTVTQASSKALLLPNWKGTNSYCVSYFTGLKSACTLCWHYEWNYWFWSCDNFANLLTSLPHLSAFLSACLNVPSIKSMDSSDLSDGPITLQEYLEVKKALASSEAKVQQLMKVNNNLSEELRRLQKEVGSAKGGQGRG